jgi:hypothetical protein
MLRPNSGAFWAVFEGRPSRGRAKMARVMNVDATLHRLVIVGEMIMASGNTMRSASSYKEPTVLGWIVSTPGAHCECRPVPIYSTPCAGRMQVTDIPFTSRKRLLSLGHFPVSLHRSGEPLMQRRLQSDAHEPQHADRPARADVALRVGASAPPVIVRHAVHELR